MAVKVEMLPKVITVSYLLVAIHGSLFSFFSKKSVPYQSLVLFGAEREETD